MGEERYCQKCSWAGPLARGWSHGARTDANVAQDLVRCDGCRLFICTYCPRTDVPRCRAKCPGEKQSVSETSKKTPAKGNGERCLLLAREGALEISSQRLTQPTRAPPPSDAVHRIMRTLREDSDSGGEQQL